ncbi:MAG: hypothetical protein H7321_10290 [Bacteroidia bacterium]|nr:hypothetical protein [Bacteroidia bacterium]
MRYLKLVIIFLTFGIPNATNAQNTKYNKQVYMKGGYYLLTNIPDFFRLQPSLTFGKLLEPWRKDSLVPRQRFLELSVNYNPWGYFLKQIDLPDPNIMDHIISTRFLYKSTSLRRRYWAPVLSGRFGFYPLSRREENVNFFTTGTRITQSAVQGGIGVGFQNGVHRYRSHAMSDFYYGVQISFNKTFYTVESIDRGFDLTVFNPPQTHSEFKVVPQLYLGWRFGGSFGH